MSGQMKAVFANNALFAHYAFQHLRVNCIPYGVVLAWRCPALFHCAACKSSICLGFQLAPLNLCTVCQHIIAGLHPESPSNVLKIILSEAICFASSVTIHTPPSSDKPQTRCALELSLRENGIALDRYGYAVSLSSLLWPSHFGQSKTGAGTIQKRGSHAWQGQKFYARHSAQRLQPERVRHSKLFV